jgi:hypothetical protein
MGWRRKDRRNWAMEGLGLHGCIGHPWISWYLVSSSMSMCAKEFLKGHQQGSENRDRMRTVQGHGA